MDDSGDQQIDFKEFVCMIFLFCSVSEHHFNEFAFSLYDTDGSHTLELDEIDELIAACYGSHWKSRPKVVKMVDSLAVDNEISLNDWESILKTHPFFFILRFLSRNVNANVHLVCSASKLMIDLLHSTNLIKS